MTFFWIFYTLGALFTALYSAYATGVEQVYIKKIAPQTLIVNWTNTFFLAVQWPAYWAAILGYKVTIHANPSREEAASKLGITLSEVTPR